MTFWKAASVIGAWLAFTATVALGVLTANAQDPAEPAGAGAAAETAAPMETPPANAAPAAEVAPAASEQTTAPAGAAPQARGAASTNLTAKDLAIGAEVFGADGAKIGEINRVTAEATGAIKEIHVTTGGKAGLNADAVVVPADKIADAGDGVKLSLSASEAMALPPVAAGAG